MPARSVFGRESYLRALAEPAWPAAGASAGVLGLHEPLTRIAEALEGLLAVARNQSRPPKPRKVRDPGPVSDLDLLQARDLLRRIGIVR